MRRRPLLVIVPLAVALAGGASAQAAVTDTVTATVVGGALTLTGVGANAAADATPGVWSSAVGATALTVSDLRLSTAGWRVTATYSAPTAPGVTALGADNVRVTAGGVTGDITGTALTLATDAPLTSPVTVATTGDGTGAGVTAFTSSYDVRVPASATLGQVYGGTVTYTVASVR